MGRNKRRGIIVQAARSTRASAYSDALAAAPGDARDQLLGHAIDAELTALSAERGNARPLGKDEGMTRYEQIDAAYAQALGNVAVGTSPSDEAAWANMVPALQQGETV